MRNMLRLVSLLLCLVLLWTGAAAAGPAEGAAPEAVEETASLVPDEPLEAVAAEPEAAEPADTPEPAATPELTAEPAETPEPTAEPAETPEKPLTEMTDEEIIAKFNLTTNWSRQALIFAVRSGIMKGVSENDLAPKSNTTHAHVAAMLMRILKTDKLADLSGYTDVRASSWYYTDMQKAVSLGLFPIADRNATVLEPNVSATREEVFVILARMFGVHSDSRQGIYGFSDWADVSDWAATDLSAMVEAGYVVGSGGKLLPKNYITREEFAQVLYQLLTKIGSSLDTTDFTGRMALASDTVPSGATIHGDLLLSTDQNYVFLSKLTVTGKLIVQGNGFVRLELWNCSINELVLCRDAMVISGTPLNTVTNYGLLRLDADAKTVNDYSVAVVLEGHTVETLNVGNGGRVAIAANAVVQNLNVLGNDVYINGDGTVGTLTVRGENFTNRVAVVQKLVNKPYNTAETVTVTRLDSGVATAASPVLNLQLKLSNMPEGWSECLVRWFVDGNEAHCDERLLLQEGSVLSLPHDFKSYLAGYHEQVRFTVYFSCRGKSVLLYLGYVDVSDGIRAAAGAIRTQNVQGKLKSSGTLYSSMYLSGAIKTYSAGTKVTILQSRLSSYTKVRMPDGNVGWMSYSNVSVSSDKFYVTYDYPTAVKEYFVNHIKNWGSNTSYMIWVSLYTQRFNVFQGYKGHWKLVRTGPIASGKNYCPTPVEDVYLKYHTTWNYEHYYCHHVTVFDEARGFHSRPTCYASDGGGIYDYSMGYPASSGCVRLLDEDAVYISSLPCSTSESSSTAVHIY